MALAIKTLKDKDANEVINLILNIQQNEFNISISIEDQPDLRTIERSYIANGGNFWGAYVDGELVGTIALIKFNSYSGAIRKMFVKKEFRGKPLHIAQTLFDMLLSYCHKNEIKSLFLGTVSVLKAAHRFYERNGFEKIPKEQLPVDFPLMGADDVFYANKLIDVK